MTFLATCVCVVRRVVTSSGLIAVLLAVPAPVLATVTAHGGSPFAVASMIGAKTASIDIAGGPTGVKVYTVRVSVDAAGTVTLAELVGQVPEGLRGVVTQAATLAQFEPAMRGGIAVPSRTTLSVTVSFQPQGADYRAEVTKVSAGGGWQHNGAIPRYPGPALVQGYGANVWVRAVFRADGSVDLNSSTIESVVVRRDSGRPRGGSLTALEQQFGESVLAMMKHWTYLPDEVDGLAIGVEMYVPTRFCPPRMVKTCEGVFDQAGDPRPYVPASLDTAVSLATLKLEAAPGS